MSYETYLLLHLLSLFTLTLSLGALGLFCALKNKMKTTALSLQRESATEENNLKQVSKTVVHAVFNMFSTKPLEQSISLPAIRKKIFIFHGLSSLFLLVAGFGLMAKIGLHSFPPWILGKLLCWVIMAGVAPFLALRFPNLYAFWTAVMLAAFMAFYLATNKSLFSVAMANTPETEELTKKKPNI